MSVKSAPYYWLICDKCGATSAQGDYSAFVTVTDAELEAESAGWHCDDGKHYCEACPLASPPKAVDDQGGITP